MSTRNYTKTGKGKSKGKSKKKSSKGKSDVAVMNGGLAFLPLLAAATALQTIKPATRAKNISDASKFGKTKVGQAIGEVLKVGKMLGLGDDNTVMDRETIAYSPDINARTYTLGEIPLSSLRMSPAVKIKELRPIRASSMQGRGTKNVTVLNSNSRL